MSKEYKEKRLFIIDEKYKINAYSYEEALKIVQQMHREKTSGWLLA